MALHTAPEAYPFGYKLLFHMDIFFVVHFVVGKICLNFAANNRPCSQLRTILTLLVASSYLSNTWLPDIIEMEQRFVIEPKLVLLHQRWPGLRLVPAFFRETPCEPSHRADHIERWRNLVSLPPNDELPASAVV
jgi:hypothetical protein